MKKILAVLLALLVFAGCSNTPKAEPTATPEVTEEPTVAPTEGAEETVTPEGTTAFTPGVYQETVAGNNGDITVEVELSENAIVRVEVLEHSETEGLSDEAINDLPKAIVEANGTAVDTVSGATVTSEAILKAVNTVLEANTVVAE